MVFNIKYTNYINKQVEPSGGVLMHPYASVNSQNICEPYVTAFISVFYNKTCFSLRPTFNFNETQHNAYFFFISRDETSSFSANDLFLKEIFQVLVESTKKMKKATVYYITAPTLLTFLK